MSPEPDRKKEAAARIRAEGTALDYEAEALGGIARSWELDPQCADLALKDAQAFGLLAVARELAGIRAVLARHMERHSAAKEKQ